MFPLGVFGNLAGADDGADFAKRFQFVDSNGKGNRIFHTSLEPPAKAHVPKVN